MNLVVSNHYNGSHIINTTGDYNITKGIDKILMNNMQNYKIIDFNDYLKNLTYHLLCKKYLIEL